ncbi:hypothetical protein [Rhizobium azibense]|uniref:Uncharacterized protein n=1 Tax=Rhizobium azibense TaxID=1136135 RepID=A0A4R3RL24_9HYPH|nr:hypothetical protein [Rhizobium azibense]TCU35227.1 hypothetical protein EV129_110229 [Rhizobium azibense]
MSAGFDAVSCAIQLFPQGDSAQNIHLEVTHSSCHFPDDTASIVAARRHRDHAGTGLVTFGVYEYSNGGRTLVRSAGMTPQALQADQAGTRVVYGDAQKIQALEEGPKAGCDAGKGAIEPAAGSLAWRNTPGSQAAVSAAVAVCDGSERNRVKC